jgi:hypothetical protein
MVKILLGLFLGAVIEKLVARWLRERARLIYYIQSVLVHTLPEFPIRVRLPTLNEPNPPTVPLRISTHSITISNNGTRAAQNVEVIHTTYLPRTVTVFPSDVSFTVDRDHRIIRFPTIVPHQQITIGYFDGAVYTFQDILNTVVRSEEGFARPMAMTQNPIMPGWFNITVLVLLLLGILAGIFIVYKLSPQIINACSWLFEKITK